MQWSTTVCIHRGSFRFATGAPRQSTWEEILTEYKCFWAQKNAKVIMNVNIFIGMKGSEGRGLKYSGFWPSSDRRERRKEKKKKKSGADISLLWAVLKRNVEQQERDLGFRIWGIKILDELS